MKNVGSKVGGVAAKALPVAAPIIGTAFGGPLGGAIGGTLGGLAGKALGGATAPRRPGRPGAQPVLGKIPAGSSATAQLMSFLQNPKLLQSVLGQVLGPAGRSSVPVGPKGAPAPFGAFMNALSNLANQAALEANAREDAQETPRYLLDDEGEFKCDPAVPEERAQVLVEQLREDYFAEADDEDDPAGADDEEEDGLAEWFVEAGLVEHNSRYRSRRPSRLRRPIPRPRGRYYY
ncbi:MAG: hypothetical protein WBD99_10760 [Thermodesulfobacteriota bacterium]